MPTAPGRPHPRGVPRLLEVGMDLAGYLVERTAGMPFADYAQENILGPWAWTGAPSPPARTPAGAWRPGITTGAACGRRPHPVPGRHPGCGVEGDGGGHGPAPGRPPAGGRLPARARRGGTPTNAQPAVRIPPTDPGRDLRVPRAPDGRAAGTGSPGYMPGFVSLVCLIPELDLGFFVACNNSHTKESMNASLLHAFFTRFFPPGPPVGRARRRPAPWPASPATTGRSTTRTAASRSSPASCNTSTSGWAATACCSSAGTSGSRSARPCSTADGEYATFREGGDGASHLLMGLDALERLPGYERLPAQLAIAAGFALVFLSGCVFWPLALMVRWHERGRAAPSRTPARGTGSGPVGGGAEPGVPRRHRPDPGPERLLRLPLRDAPARRRPARGAAGDDRNGGRAPDAGRAVLRHGGWVRPWPASTCR